MTRQTDTQEQTMTTTATEFTAEVRTINGTEVTKFGGHAVPAYSTRGAKAADGRGHTTGWKRWSGARTTYVVATCTCRAGDLEGETRTMEGDWRAALAADALAHILAACNG